MSPATIHAYLYAYRMFKAGAVNTAAALLVVLGYAPREAWSEIEHWESCAGQLDPVPDCRLRSVNA